MAIHELFAYIHVKNTDAAIEFYKTVFGVTEKFRLVEPGGRIGHAELDFNGATLMLSDEYPELGVQAPQAGAASTVTLHLHVDNCDEVIARALQAGATLEMAAQDHFYGERSGNFRDPFGHRWNVGHTIEDVTPEEMQRRYTAMMNTSAS
ncbi:VOC family protein [Polaromonas sp. SM01]|uniref:VOC family protein n=1 Tax=Polaromonas sp. SM01 TaxID=3085630 RepID=UPI00298144BE|nr:VOC family protein [Polaromonas sp. SM01]MDW5442667.1 VOC family protein [Polaromonas sp. SM01]